MFSFLEKIPGEIWVGLSTFALGYLAHIRGINEQKLEEKDEREKRRLHAYEIELESIGKRQASIQDYMEKTLERLEGERDKLNERIIRLQAKIEKLEDENLQWQMKYIELLKNCPPIHEG